MPEKSKGKIKIVFMGTPESALPSLKSLFLHPDFEIQTVVTQPDKPLPPPVKLLALEYNLSVLQPEKVSGNKEFINLIKDLKPDFLVVIAYGELFPKEFLEIPKYMPVNVHFSLLPKYRGASPIQSALLNGEKETGISIIKIAQKMDTGDILLVRRVEINEKDNKDSLTRKLADLCGEMLPFVLKDIKDGYLTPLPQNEKDATYCKIIQKEDGLIDWKKHSATEIIDMIRAFTDWPSTYTYLDKKLFKIFEAEKKEGKAKPGEIVFQGKKTIGIGTKKNLLIPKRVQLEGKKEMEIGEFLRGHMEKLKKIKFLGEV